MIIIVVIVAIIISIIIIIIIIITIIIHIYIYIYISSLAGAPAQREVAVLARGGKRNNIIQSNIVMLI